MMTKRVSTSFNKDQIYLMHEILTQLTRGGDPKLLVRNKAYGGLVKSVQQLRDRADNPNPPRPKTASEPPTIAPEERDRALVQEALTVAKDMTVTNMPAAISTVIARVDTAAVS